MSRRRSPSIAVQSKEKLPALIDSPIAAINAGELDDMLRRLRNRAEANRERRLDERQNRSGADHAVPLVSIL
jgi:hypothetical protein